MSRPLLRRGTRKGSPQLNRDYTNQARRKDRMERYHDVQAVLQTFAEDESPVAVEEEHEEEGSVDGISAEIAAKSALCTSFVEAIQSRARCSDGDRCTVAAEKDAKKGEHVSIIGLRAWCAPAVAGAKPT